MIEKRILPNGITLMSEYLPYVQSAAVGVWALAGAVDESTWDGADGRLVAVGAEADGAGVGSEAESPAADSVGADGYGSAPAGISHLIEHMLFKGTGSRSAKDIAEEVDRTGGLINAFTGKEATCYYIKTLAEHLGESVDLLGDMFLNSVFDETELGKEKNVIYEEMNMIEDSPEDLGHDLLDEAVFSGMPLGNRIIGYKETVGSAGPAEIRAYTAARYAAGNVVLSVAGNFEIDEVAARVTSAFGGVQNGRSARIAKGAEHTPAFLSRAKDIEQSHIFLGRRGVSLTSDDYYAFILFNSILGGSMSSRLFQKIREEKGLAYSVYSMSSSFVDDGIFMIYAGVGEGNERVTIEAIREETERIASEGADESELAKVKEQSKGAYVFGRENVQTRMFSTGKNELLLGKVYTSEEIIAGIDAVTPKDIARLATRCADLAEYSAVIVGKNELTKQDVGL
ncbi:MAG: insulinase family protein [Clostridiales Family XIII bacterium]|jgi:predicted Zn-dependent peptidase|nr:insulinase family protein [Clostridiales Family XIII bacterium]